VRAARAPGPDPAEQVALVAHARRELLLRAHRHRLRREDLEDCYSQATLELVTRALRGAPFSSRLHVEHALEQRFLSRIYDRRRALSGRSPMQAALESASSIDAAHEQPLEIIDVRAGVEELVILRQELRRLSALSARLTDDQRLVLASQLAQEPSAEFCRRQGWTPEKYRKVAQRGRARLRRLLAEAHGALE
jgi:DNA-directed RNA polymerase specialized sigma24 family protein